MANEPSWDDIFRPAGAASAGAASAGPASTGPGDPQDGTDPAHPGVRTTDPFALAAAQAGSAARAAPATELLTRRELREREQRAGTRDGAPRRRGRLVVIWVLIGALVLGTAAAGAAWVLWEDRIRDILGWTEPDDFVGSGNGVPVDVTITSGEIGEDVANSLVEAGVTKTFDAFYELLLSLDEPPAFIPGTYELQQEMSARSALDALLDESNRKVDAVAIREGLTLPGYADLLSAGTGIPVAEFEAAFADYTAYGLPEDAVSLEGYLFPANYEFDPGVSAHDIVQLLVDRTFQSLDASGVAPEDRNRVLTIASIIQREARLPDDFYRVSRVIQNRLVIPMRLEMDSTAQYGDDAQDSAFSTAEQLAAVNGYNTYTHDGLPIGPIAGVGDLAIDAAVHPADGPWIFFVTVNLDTGETLFSETAEEHQRGVDQLRQWCRETDHPAC